MKKTILLISIILSILGCNNKLTCNDFKNGEFLIPGDSLVAESFRIIRNENLQIEYSTNGNMSHIDIKYIDDCNYILTYNSTKNDLDDYEKYVNSSGGNRIKVLEIRGDTLIYSSLLQNDSIKFEQPGRIIKLK